MRGRDHGLLSYNKMKKFCLAHPVYKNYYSGWDGMKSHWNPLVQQFYKNKHWDVDLYVGLLSEKEKSAKFIYFNFFITKFSKMWR